MVVTPQRLKSSRKSEFPTKKNLLFRHFESKTRTQVNCLNFSSSNECLPAKRHKPTQQKRGQKTVKRWAKKATIVSYQWPDEKETCIVKRSDCRLKQRRSANPENRQSRRVQLNQNSKNQERTKRKPWNGRTFESNNHAFDIIAKIWTMVRSHAMWAESRRWCFFVIQRNMSDILLQQEHESES